MTSDAEQEDAVEVHERDRQWRVENLVEEIQEGRIEQKRLAGFVKVLIEATQPHMGSTEDMAARLLAGLRDAIDFDRAFVVTVDSEASPSVLARNLSDGKSEAQPSKTILARVLNEGVSIHTFDAQSDERFTSSSSIIGGEIRGVLCAPFFDGDATVGAIYVDSLAAKSRFGNEELTLLESVASLAGGLLRGDALEKGFLRAEQLGAVGAAAAKILAEIKEPLDAIRSGANDASSEADSAQWQKTKDTILTAVDSIEAAIDGTLKMASGDVASESHVDLNSIIQTAISLTKPVSADRIGMHVILNPVPAISGKPTLLLQLFVNLLRNAVKAVADGGTIEVVSESKGAGVKVLINDTGCGMDEKVAQQASTPFFTTDADGGIGLGLAICRQVVDAHAGTLEIKSTPRGGTKVTVELPGE